MPPGRSCVLAAALALAPAAAAQQLEPRAYSPAPVGLNFAGVLSFYSSGDVSLDDASPLQDVHVAVFALAPFYSRTFGLLGRQASVLAAAPFARGSASGRLVGETRAAERTGPGDPRLRLAVNLLGGPALTPAEFRLAKPATTLGASLTVDAPLGQYDPSKLFNLGTNRWALKPELGFSQPVGAWSLEAYAGVWVFTDNPDFLGTHVKSQQPLLSTQAHLVRGFGPRAWGALDFTYFSGGAVSLDGQASSPRQSNARLGATAAAPLTARQSLKAGYARGVGSRVGSKFSTYALTWQCVW